MSILLKGFKMPKACINAGCPIGGEYCELWWKPGGSEYGRHRDCPLIELPDHGDLIDRDDLNTIKGKTLLEAVYYAPVIIPAERSEDETD